jgi:hypothetical protein
MMARKIPALGFQSEETRKPRLLAAALRDDGSFVDRIKKYSEEDNDKLLLLCRHYGIQASPFMFYELALALAREIYPEPKKRGRKSKWTFLNKGVLVVEVERRMRQDKPGYGVAWACSKLAKIEPWASFLEKKEGVTLNPDPAEALRQIYFDFRGDDWAEISRKKFREYKREGAIAKWEEQVSDFVRNPHPK